MAKAMGIRLMMHRGFVLSLWAAATVIVVFAAWGCRKAASPAAEEAAEAQTAEVVREPARPLPLLVVDTAAPLLLDEQEEGADEWAVKDGADNSSCFVCHANYRREGLAVQHARAHVGCVTCHGDSFEHRNDENNTTPPDKMIALDELDAFCGKCHKRHNVVPREVIARYRERSLEAADTESIVCTDCHGNHRLKIRSVRWDRKTGELL